MTDERINQRIAEACGWTQVNAEHRSGRAPNAEYVGSEFISNYCNDLNAMHEAEKVMTKAQWEDFVQHLANDWSSVSDAWKDVCHATARQRAEAFLRTLGKWHQSGDVTEMVEEVQK